MSAIVGLGTAVPEESYTQAELLDIFAIADPRIRSIFSNTAIERRYLKIPPRDPSGLPVVETYGELLARNRTQSIDMGARAINECLKDSGASLSDVSYLCCITSTGFMTPGLSALLIRELGISPHCGRLDVVGMGCNAGLNAMAAVSGWADAHPGKLALAVCVEACSAAYVFDGTIRTSVVNSLFGDGAAAVAVLGGDRERPDRRPFNPEIVKFASSHGTHSIDELRFDWDEDHAKFSFFVGVENSYLVGAGIETAVDLLLADTELRRSSVDHWIVHTGGRRVVDAIMVNLGLTRHEMRHTVSVLRDFGNVSSASFLFSYRRLMDEDLARPGDHGVMITIGPGLTIETALLRW